MPHDFHSTDLVPLAATVSPGVEVRAAGVRIHDVTLTRPAIVAYLREIDGDKQVAAVLHLLDVGLAEVLHRRRLAR